jgi:hypothetical protein
MVKSLTNGDILQLWVKCSIVSVLIAFGIQIMTTFMKNGNENIPSEEECEKLSERHLTGKFHSFDEFYPYYLCEHSLGTTKFFHFIATVNGLAILATLFLRKWQTKLFIFGFVQAYGLAWFSHFFIQQNRPATWIYPTYSFFGDNKMFFDILTLKFPPFMQ